MFAINSDVRYIGRNPLFAGFSGIIESIVVISGVVMAYRVHSFENYGEVVPFFAEELETI